MFIVFICYSFLAPIAEKQEMSSLSYEFLNSHEDEIFLFSLCEASVGKNDLAAGSAQNAVCARCSTVSSLSLSYYHQ